MPTIATCFFFRENAMPNAATDICQRHRLTVAEYYRMAEIGILL